MFLAFLRTQRLLSAPLTGYTASELVTALRDAGCTGAGT